jgi:hypothetical protein|tara:strand:+ start:315 stop:431 length:117 start_codon:yes stop_codon:yes gene_type:complete
MKTEITKKAYTAITYALISIGMTWVLLTIAGAINALMS